MRFSCVKFLVACALLFFNAGCTSIYYFPRIPKKQFYDPAKVNLKQEDVFFRDSEGTLLHGWWFAAQTPVPKGSVIFFHGNGENLTSHFLSLSWLPAAGYNYFIFDYPGYGLSEGTPSPFENIEAGKAAIKWVHDKKDPSPLVIYGQSLGGNIAYRTVLDVKNEVPIRDLVVDGTFLSYRSLAREKASESWLLWIFQPLAWLLMSDNYAPNELEKRAPIPLLVIHGQLDPVVPPSYGDRVFAKSVEPKTMWKIENGVHGDTFWSNQRIYRQKFLDFIAQ